MQHGPRRGHAMAMCDSILLEHHTPPLWTQHVKSTSPGRRCTRNCAWYHHTNNAFFSHIKANAPMELRLKYFRAALSAYDVIRSRRMKASATRSCPLDFIRTYIARKPCSALGQAYPETQPPVYALHTPSAFTVMNSANVVGGNFKSRDQSSSNIARAFLVLNMDSFGRRHNRKFAARDPRI